MSPYDPRTIALFTELLHPPRQPAPDPIQRLHDELFRSGARTYHSFSVTPLGPFLSNPSSQRGAVSQAAFLGDRFQFREELTALTVEDFARRVREVASRAAELCGVQLFTGQRVTIRCLVNPRHVTDAREFLRSVTCSEAPVGEVFGREPGVFGLRLVFPPSASEPEAHSLRIESYGQDPRSLFLEDQGTFRPIPVPAGLDAIEGNVLASYRFLGEKALRFVASFDRRGV